MLAWVILISLPIVCFFGKMGVAGGASLCSKHRILSGQIHLSKLWQLGLRHSSCTMRLDPEQNREQDAILDLESEPESFVASPADLFQPLDHYERNFQDHGKKKIVPPPEVMRKLSEQRKSPAFLECRIPKMSEDVARNALLSFVNSKCCYGNRAAGELVIQELKQQMLHRYRLETFIETRVSEWTFEPCTNALVDGPQNGEPPQLWNIKVQAPQMFQEDTKKFRVPHSSLVKECHKCHGRGRYKCSGCHGAGRMRCVTCCGAKHRSKYQKRCQMCSGTGRKRKNNTYEFISDDQFNFPRELLSTAMGDNIFKEENTLVYPLVGFPYPDMALASQRATAEHMAAFASTSNVLQQRQTVELIPVTEVHYQYAGKMYLYYVYGMENKVYALDYPERYCCGCTIL
ncbi:protein SSUH2 homolog isoform X3 [Paroedura picta]|uniref:protein SSUH2 homolog isoform X3 n=1 Tax=Paroedura picta TaxID=143630 RepID=UPI0040571E69